MNVSWRNKASIRLLVWCWCIASMFFLTYGLSPHESLLFQLRFERWLALNIVGVSVAVATFVFQVVVQNRILTPSIIGLDSVYLLFNIALLSALGGMGFQKLPAKLVFLLTTLIMIAFAVFIYGVLLLRFKRDLGRLLLMGIVIGMFTQTMTEFLARLLSPDSFAAFQGVAFARFDHVGASLLKLVFAVLVGIFLVLWKLRFVMDIYRLGHSHVVNLGIPFLGMTCLLLMIVAVLVSVSAALVGPIFFFGLLVAAAINALMVDATAGTSMIACALLGALILVLGQAVFEHILSMKSTLSVAVELVGGVVFFVLLWKRAKS